MLAGSAEDLADFMAGWRPGRIERAASSPGVFEIIGFDFVRSIRGVTHS